MKKFTQGHLYNLVTRGLLLVIVLMGLSRLVKLFFVPNPKWPELSNVHEVVVTNPYIESLWVHPKLFSTGGEQSLLVAGNGMVFLLGSDDRYSKSKVIAFDEQSGEIKWSVNYPEGRRILLSSSSLYTGGVGKVIALDPSTGELVWETTLPLSRSVTVMLLHENILYIDTVSGRYHMLDAQTGEIIQTVNYSNTDKMPLWREKVFDSAESGLVNDVLKRRGEQRISNIAKSEENLYVLTQNGNILQINSQTENEIFLASFDLTPFLSQNSKGNPYYFYIAVDDDNELLFIYLGDSGQMFALRIVE